MLDFKIADVLQWPDRCRVVELHSHAGLAIGLVQWPQVEVLQIGKRKQAAIASGQIGYESTFLHIAGICQQRMSTIPVACLRLRQKQPHRFRSEERRVGKEGRSRW